MQAGACKRAWPTESSRKGHEDCPPEPQRVPAEGGQLGAEGPATRETDCCCSFPPLHVTINTRPSTQNPARHPCGYGRRATGPPRALGRPHSVLNEHGALPFAHTLSLSVSRLSLSPCLCLWRPLCPWGQQSLQPHEWFGTAGWLTVPERV